MLCCFRVSIAAANRECGDVTSRSTMEKGSTINVTFSDNIAYITINRPEQLNALTMADYEAFALALEEINERPDILVRTNSV